MARRIAAEILGTIVAEGQFLSEALNDSDAYTKAADLDQRFIRQLVTTALRHNGFLDFALDRFLKSPLKDLDPEILLKLGITELLYMETPAYAAINEYVKLSKKLKMYKYSKLINAVLRSTDREREDLAKTPTATKTTPDWLFESWKKAYGPDSALKIAESHLHQPPLDITINGTPKPDGEEIVPGTIRIENAGRVEKLPGFKEGAWWVQDVAATFPAKLLGDVKGKTVLDICAAPGGKTAQLCASGADVTALDISDHRLKVLKNNMQRLKISPTVVEKDVFEYAPSEKFDAILLDAPCSATGTIRRHPDLPWIKNPDQVKEMASIQHNMLVKAAEFLKPGGGLVYCTCSLQPEEGEKQIEAILPTGLYEMISLSATDFSGQIPDVAFTKTGMLRTLPFYHQKMDGFFAALLRRLP